MIIISTSWVSSIYPVHPPYKRTRCDLNTCISFATSNSCWNRNAACQAVSKPLLPSLVVAWPTRPISFEGRMEDQIYCFPHTSLLVHRHRCVIALGTAAVTWADEGPGARWWPKRSIMNGPQFILIFLKISDLPILPVSLVRKVVGVVRCYKASPWALNTRWKVDWIPPMMHWDRRCYSIGVRCQIESTHWWR